MMNRYQLMEVVENIEPAGVEHTYQEQETPSTAEGADVVEDHDRQPEEIAEDETYDEIVGIEQISTEPSVKEPIVAEREEAAATKEEPELAGTLVPEAVNEKSKASGIR